MTDPAKQNDGAYMRLYQSYASSGQSVSSNKAASKCGARQRFYLRLISRHLPSVRTVAIFDCGSGDGGLISALKLEGYRNVEGYDVSAEQVSLAHANGAGEVRLGDFRTALEGFREKYDVIFLLDVLEHFDVAGVLSTLDLVYSALKLGGVVVIHVPNAAGLHGHIAQAGDLTHRTAFTSRSIGQALGVCGFVSIRCFEDTPIVHGPVSACRLAIWHVLSLPARVRVAAEMGVVRNVLSQNMIVCASK